MSDSKEPEQKPADASTDKKPASAATTAKTVKKSTKAAKSDTKKPASASNTIATAALLIAIATAVVAGWLWLQLQQAGRALVEQNLSSQTETGQLRDRINRLDSGLNTKIRQQNQRINTLEEDVNTAINSAERVAETLTALHSKLNTNPKTGWLIAEAEYLLATANQQLQLVGNVDTSIKALRNADQRLRETGDPTLIDIRSLIADEITQLQSVQVLDVAGAALTLASMQSHVNELSLAGHTETSSPTVAEDGSGGKDEAGGNGWRTGLNTAWQAIKELVVIRERGDDATGSPLLTPDQRALIYQNLRLKLESARLSLVQHDSVTFKQSLEISRDWLLKYFDADAKRNALKDTINELSRIEIDVALPDISASLNALRAWQQQQDSAE